MLQSPNLFKTKHMFQKRYKFIIPICAGKKHKNIHKDIHHSHSSHHHIKHTIEPNIQPNIHDNILHHNHNSGDPSTINDHGKHHDYFIIPPKIKNTDLLYEGCVYTDASIMNKMAGIGIWSNHYEFSNSWSLKGMLDINRAELGAILVALIKLNYEGNVHILSDSLTSLKLINGSLQLDKFSLITHCIHYIKDNWKGILKFKKVKGHSGNIGNENADKLAHDGVMNHHTNKCIYLPDDLYKGEKRDHNIKDIVSNFKNINEL